MVSRYKNTGVVLNDDLDYKKVFTKRFGREGLNDIQRKSVLKHLETLELKYPTLTEVTSPEETSHVNLNRMLSLACVCFVQAQNAAKDGNIQMKEYYMREFYKKLADNESNKRKISIAFPSPVSSVR